VPFLTIKGSLPAVLILFLTMLLGFPFATWAEPEGERVGSLWQFGQTCCEDAKYILTSAGTWEREDWMIAALVAGTTLVLFEADPEIRDYCQEHRSDFGDALAGVFDKAGNVGCLASALGLWYLYGKASGNDRVQEVSRVGFESLVVTSGLVAVLKISTHRSRPYTGAGSYSYGGPELKWDDDRLSFASLHSAAAFSTATVIADYYRERRWVPILSYGTAALVAWSRMNDDEHWSSDVFVGSVMGYYTAKMVMAHSKEKTGKVTVAPVLNQFGAGLVLGCRF
jgi:hypothetical protein